MVLQGASEPRMANQILPARLSIIHHLKQQFQTLCAHSLTAQQLLFYMTTGLMSSSVLEDSEIFIYVLRGEEEEVRRK